MKRTKRAIISICALVLGAAAFLNADMKVAAEEAGAIVDHSVLTTDSESHGTAGALTRGYYLQVGESSLSKLGTGHVNCYGSTVANMVVADVSVNVILERLSGGSWIRVTSWTATRNNAIAVTCSNNIRVGTGSYYRVRSLHSANSDASSSYTNGLYI